MNNPKSRIFWVSVLALFVELALIRWVSCEVRIFAYFKNLVLVACFLGFGLGFYFSSHKSRLTTSLWTLLCLVAVVGLSAKFNWSWGPQSASQALSNFQGSIFMGDNPSDQVVSLARLVVGLLWTFSLFAACLFVLFGYAQWIGKDIDALGLELRLQAYSWNVAGSLIGILLFSLFSYLALSPFWWFLAVLLGTVPFLQGWASRGAALAGVIILVGVLYPQPSVIWSPYQKLELLKESSTRYRVLVNSTGYMDLHTFSKKLKRYQLDRWTMPYLVRPKAKKVLIVGAGAGNDAAAALRMGATEVVALEIDPQIYRIGKKYHPDKPYSNPRVRVVVDDARHFVETTKERFDLIIMSHLDSHTSLSSYTNVRLDNYIYTIESLRACKSLLNPSGMLYLSFWATQDWVVKRLGENLYRAFGFRPQAFHAKAPSKIIHTHYFATHDPASRKRAKKLLSNWHPSSTKTTPSTDNWPYLFVEHHQIPKPMLILATFLGVLIFLLLGFVLRRKEFSSATGWPLERHFFFLGAGFLLVEVHNVSKLARVFGTTWSVNAWVITGILLLVLLANFLSERWPNLLSVRLMYLFLFLCLLVGASLPTNVMASLPMGNALLTLAYSLPLFFAGIIFAGSFRNTQNASRALGSNILGSILGGFLELTSFYFGLSSLLYLAVVLYMLSIPRSSVQTSE